MMSLYNVTGVTDPSIAEESEQNFSEEDGWEFVTLADQVTTM